MATVAATVARIDRANHFVEVLPVGVAYPVRVPYLSATPPPPLSQVVLGQTGSGWEITQPISVPNLVFNDGFTFCQDSGVGPFLIKPYQADTSWGAGGAGGDQIFESTTLSIPGGSGIIRLFGAVGGNTAIQKDAAAYLPDPPGAYWLSGRISNLNINNNDFQGLGLDDNANRSVYFCVNGTAGVNKWQLYTNDSLGPTLTDTPYTIFQLFQGEFSYIDIVLAVGSFAALWIDGSGPYYSTTNIPSSSTLGLGTKLWVIPGGGAVSDVFADYIRLESFSPAVHPDRIGFASADIPCSK